MSIPPRKGYRLHILDSYPGDWLTLSRDQQDALYIREHLALMAAHVETFKFNMAHGSRA